MQLAGKSYRDIATYLNCPPGTVMSRRSRAMNELKRIYQEISPESFEKN